MISLNQNLKVAIKGDFDYDSVLYVLNDNIPDGADVSWIYDVHTGLINMASRNKKIYVSGIRALDMAVRLRYAAVDVTEENIKEKVSDILLRIGAEDSCKDVLVLPNYSAMLSFRKHVLGKSIL